MQRGTTPTIVFHVNGAPLQDFEIIFVTFKQRAISLDKSGDDISIDTDENTISVRLTQEETLAFDKGPVSVQIRVKSETGDAFASNIFTANMSDILKDGVI